MLSRTLALLAAVAALVLVGCGGSQLSKDEYIKELNSVGKVLNTSFSSIGEGIGNTKDTKVLGDKFTEAGKVLRDASKRVADLSPPDDAKSANAKLADGLGKMATAFDDVAKAAKDSGDNPTALLPKVTALTNSDGIKMVNDAITELSGKGYNVKQQ